MKHPFLKHILLPALCACLVVTLLVVFSPTRSARASTCQTLRYSPGQFFLAAGSRVQWTTCKGNTMDLNMQTDGNFVIYVNGQPKWASHTSSQIGDWASFDTRGDLVVVNFYSGGPQCNVSCPATYIAWQSNTANKGATALELQNDGNMVIYTASGAIWASGTHGY